MSFLRFQIPEFLVELACLLVKLPLAGLDVVFALTQLIVLVVHEVLVLAFHLKEFFLRLKYLLLLDVLGLHVCLLHDGICVTLENKPGYKQVDRYAHKSSGKDGQYVKQYHKLNLYIVNSYKKNSIRKSADTVYMKPSAELSEKASE